MREESNDIYRWHALRLSETQKEFLMGHVDGRRPVIRGHGEEATRHALIQRGFIRYHPTSAQRPTETVTTDVGRGVLCAVLAIIADRRAGTEQRRIERYFAYGLINENLLTNPKYVRHLMDSRRKTHD